MLNNNSIQFTIDKSFTNEHPPIEFFINFYKNLPDGLIESHGLLIPFDNKNVDTKFFNHIRKSYRATADWLSYYFGSRSLYEELTYTDKSLYKPFGEISRAWITIIQETFLLSPELQHEYKNPALFWMLIETEKCNNLLSNSGFTGTACPTAKGTRYTEIIAATTYLNDANNLLKKPEITNSPTQSFCSLAMELCAMPDNVTYRSKWSQFLRAIKRHERQIKQSPLKVVFLEDDLLKTLQGKGKKEI